MPRPVRGWSKVVQHVYNSYVRPPLVNSPPPVMALDQEAVALNQLSPGLVSFVWSGISGGIPVL